MLRAITLLLLCGCLLPLSAQRDNSSIYRLENGAVQISNGYSLVLTKDGRAVAYDGERYAIIEYTGELRVATREEMAALWREFQRFRCGCERNEVCINSRCYREATATDGPVAICRPPCEGGYVCINGNCIERPFDPCRGLKDGILINGHCVDAGTLPLKKLLAASEPLRGRKGLALFKLP